MEQIKRSKKENPYVVLDKTCLNDKELSWQAKGLHSYIMGLPEDWKLFLSDLENRSSDKRDCTANCLNELIAYGYAQRIRLYAERGRFAGYDYTIYESAQAEVREKELPLYLGRLSKRNQKAAENKAKRESEKGLTENGNSVNGKSENGKPDTNKETEDKLTIIQNNDKEKEPLTPFSNGKNKPKNKCEPQPIPTGLDTPDFVEAWAQLMETKKWRTKEASAVNLALKKLSAYDVAFAIQLVETATMGGYQGVVFSDTPTAYEKWQKTKQTSSQIFQQPHPNFPSRPLYVNSFADKWAKVKWWRTNLAELENGQDKEYSFTEISKMLQYTEPLNILK